MKFKSALAASLLLAGTAQAAVIMNMLEVGSDVIISGSGSINITGFSSTLAPPNSGTSFIPSQGVVSNRTLVDWRQTYNGVGLTGPTNFGAGGNTIGATPTGDIFGISRSSDTITVADGYQSNDPLSFSMTYSNTTIAGLGADIGSYVWTLSNNDTVTLNVGSPPPAIPTPLPLTLLLTGGLVGLSLRKRLQR